jgi:hypothetical protein
MNLCTDRVYKTPRSATAAVKRAVRQYSDSVLQLKHQSLITGNAIETVEVLRKESAGKVEALAVDWEKGQCGVPFCYSPSEQGVSVCAPAGWVEMNVQQRQLVSGNLKNFKKEQAIQQREEALKQACTFSPQTNQENQPIVVLRSRSSNQV